ncbi:hypothetical protein CJF30_00008095 [Rutstroemia sp. NJR-2017a BBW]|nr:hypothetical protein CJF30_00008095 [Rutstroemia sp. NJR-2017a BBW]
MEKLPGICIEPAEFWGLNWDKVKRDKFRRVFMESASYFIDWEWWDYRTSKKSLHMGELQFAYSMIQDLGPRGWNMD